MLYYKIDIRRIQKDRIIEDNYNNKTINGSYTTYRESMKSSNVEKPKMTFDMNNSTYNRTKPDFLSPNGVENIGRVSASSFAHPSKSGKNDFRNIYSAKYNSKAYDSIKNDDIDLRKYDSLEFSGIYYIIFILNLN